MNIYSVTFYDKRKKAYPPLFSGWRFYKVIAENEQQIIEYLDKHHPSRKECMFDREGNPSENAHDWTEIQCMGEIGKIKIPIFIEEDK